MALRVQGLELGTQLPAQRCFVAKLALDLGLYARLLFSASMARSAPRRIAALVGEWRLIVAMTTEVVCATKVVLWSFAAWSEHLAHRAAATSSPERNSLRARNIAMTAWFKGSRSPVCL